MNKTRLSEIENIINSLNPEIISNEILDWIYRNIENFIDNTTKHFKLDLFLDNDDLPETKKAQDVYRETGKIYDEIMEQKDKQPKEIETLETFKKKMDKIIAQSYEIMKNDKDKLRKIFEKMSFFYEKIIPNPASKQRALQIDEELKELIREKEQAKTEMEKENIQKQIVEKVNEGVALIQFTELEGEIRINKFEYEAIDVGVKLINKGQMEEDEDGEIVEKETTNRSIPATSEEKEEDNKKDKIIKEYTIPESFTIWLEISYAIKNLKPTSMF